MKRSFNPIAVIITSVYLKLFVNELTRRLKNVAYSIKFKLAAKTSGIRLPKSDPAIVPTPKRT